MTFDLPYVSQDVDRHGNVRIYYRRAAGWPKWRLLDRPGSPEFVARHAELMAMDRETQRAVKGLDTRPGGLRPVGPGTWGHLCNDYMASARWSQLDPLTQADRRGILYQTLAEPIAPGEPFTFHDLPTERMQARHVRVLRDRKVIDGKPSAANARLKAIRAVWMWAIAEEWRGLDINPCRDVERVKTPGGGFHDWTEAEVARFEARHPIGTKARLTLDIALYAGLRRSDVVRVGPDDVVAGRDGDPRRWLRFTAWKNRNRTPVLLEMPILPVLEATLAASDLGQRTWLVREDGAPFTAKGFGHKVRRWCDEAGLAQLCTLHGLRKVGSRRSAENGATAHQLMAVFGWSSLKEAQRYTAQADRRKLAGTGMSMIEPRGADVPTFADDPHPPRNKPL